MLASLFLPDASHVAPEYNSIRLCRAVAGVLTAARDALTARAHFVAVGVGSASASPFAAVAVAEFVALVTNTFGVWLAGVVGSSLPSAYARLVTVINTSVIFLLGCLPLWLLGHPEYFLSVSLATAILTTIQGAFATPAYTALFNHLHKSKVLAERAQLDRAAANQDAAVALCRSLVRLAVLQWAASRSPSDVLLPWAAVSLTLVAALLARALLVQPPSLDALRLRAALAMWGRSVPPTVAALTALEIRHLLSYTRPQQWDIGGVGVHPRDVDGDFDALLGVHEDVGYVMGRQRGGGSRLCVVLKAAPTGEVLLMAALQAECFRRVLANAPLDFLSAVKVAKRRARHGFDAWLQSLRGGGMSTSTVLLPQADGWVLEGTQASAAGVTTCVMSRKSAAGEATVDAYVCGGKPPLEAPRTAVGAIKSAAATVLLPAGFPDTVCEEYLRFQVFDTLQVACADLRGAVLAAAALKAMGVGSATATVSNALLVSVASELCGQFTRLCMGAWVNPARVAADMKLWRMASAGVSLVASLLVVVEAGFPGHRLYIRCASACVVAAAAAACGGANTQLIAHLGRFSLEPGLRADVALKEGNQDKVLSTVLLVCRWGVMSLVGLSVWRVGAAVATLSVGHLVFNYLAMQAVVLRNFNNNKLGEVLGVWQAAGSVPTPAAVSWVDLSCRRCHHTFKSTLRDAVGESSWPRFSKAAVASGWRVDNALLHS